jgi:hypothetical protein
MREITIGDTKLGVRGSPLALLYYKQAFRSDLVGDISRMGGPDAKKGQQLDPERLDTVVLLQATWAMAKANAGVSAQFPPFESWLESLSGLDFSAPEFLGAVMEEIVDGFFRGQRGPVERRRAHQGRR